jgi:hypothetical protein
MHGDDNTTYFQLLANGRYRKTRIYQLEQEEGVIVGEENLKIYITNYYKGLFGSSESNQFTLDETHIEDMPQVSDLENEILSDAFSENEIKEAIFQMEHNKAPGPDGFPAEFYQHFWDIIKPDLMALFNKFHQGTLPLHCLNFGVITLLPTKTEATMIQQYRPIFLLNVSFKIFTKVITNIINLVAEKVIGSSQTTFLPGRNIMEGVVVLHETIHELHRKRKMGLFLS